MMCMKIAPKKVMEQTVKQEVDFSYPKCKKN